MEKERRTAWVVDDDVTYQNMISSFLDSIGYAPKGFTSGKQCLEHLAEKPEFIILDHHLNESHDGLDILRHIKYQNAQQPVIYISAGDNISLVSDSYKHGAVAFIEKDSASLLRLKLTIEKLEKIKLIKKIRRKKLFRLLAVATIFVTLIIMLSFGLMGGT